MRFLTCSVMVPAVLLSACRDQAKRSMVAPIPDVRATSALLSIAPAAGVGVTSGANDFAYDVTVQLLSSSALTAVGSITASIDFDTARVRFVEENSPADAAMRAANVERGRLRIAASSATGIQPASLMRLRFIARDTAALRGMALGVSELHLLDASDLKPALVIAAPVLVQTAGSTP